MTKIIMTHKQTRVRCSDERFLEAVFSSKTYAEVAEKTGQKIASTIARYARTKDALSKQGIDLPVMEKAKPEKKIDAVENMIKIVQRLKGHHSD